MARRAVHPMLLKKHSSSVEFKKFGTFASYKTVIWRILAVMRKDSTFVVTC